MAIFDVLKNPKSVLKALFAKGCTNRIEGHGLVGFGAETPLIYGSDALAEADKRNIAEDRKRLAKAIGMKL